MRSRCHLGGFDFMPRPSPKYYRDLPAKIGPDAGVSEKLLKECEELGILVDRDDQGTLLQIFTRPVGDRWGMHFYALIQWLFDMWCCQGCCPLSQECCEVFLHCMLMQQCGRGAAGSPGVAGGDAWRLS